MPISCPCPSKVVGKPSLIQEASDAWFSDSRSVVKSVKISRSERKLFLRPRNQYHSVALDAFFVALEPGALLYFPSRSKIVV